MITADAFLRRTVRATTLASVPVAAFLAAPAFAAEPEGWSNPDPVSFLQLAFWMAGAPLALALLIVLITLGPAMARGERLIPDHNAHEGQWLGGASEKKELSSAGAAEDAETGGARGSW